MWVTGTSRSRAPGTLRAAADPARPSFVTLPPITSASAATWEAARDAGNRDDGDDSGDIADLGWVLHEAVAAHRRMW